MMKKIILPAVGTSLLMANIAMANDEKISSLMFIPKEKVWHGETFVQDTRSTFDKKAVEVKEQTTTLNQEIGLGLTDRLSYKLQFSTILSDETEIKTAAGTTTSKNEGISEPAIEIKYRFDSIIPWAKKFDMAVNYSPRIKDAQTANGSMRGLNFRGNHEIGVTANIGEEISSTRSWMAEAHFSYFTKTTAKDRNVEAPFLYTHTDHTMHGTLGFSWQEMLGENYGVSARAELAYRSKYTQSGGTSASEDATFGAGLGAEAFWNYKTKIKYYTNLGLRKMTDRDLKVGNDTVKVESQWDSSAVIGAKYLF